MDIIIPEKLHNESIEQHIDRCAEFIVNKLSLMNINPNTINYNISNESIVENDIITLDIE